MPVGVETPNELMVVFSNTISAGFDALQGSVNGVFGLMIALVVALTGVGSLVSNVPAAIITSRYGERLAMIGAAVFSVLALLLCIAAVHVWMLAAGVFMVGMAGSVFTLARQTFLIEAVPITLRARALSTLAGSMRIGVFIGPFAGAALIHVIGLQGAFWVALAAMVGVGAIALVLPDLKAHPAQGVALVEKPSLANLMRSHAGVYLTLGLGALLVSALRASRSCCEPSESMKRRCSPRGSFSTRMRLSRIIVGRVRAL